jgi:hypothetical protein
MVRMGLPVLAALALLIAGACTDPPAGLPTNGAEAWVDPTLGTDDLDHGGGPGAAAFQTITYALQHATATIHLGAGTYAAATGETFPLVLTGDQTLAGGADLSAKVVGDAPFAPSDPTNPLFTTIALTGHANRIDHVDVTIGAPNLDWSPACIRITTSGAHVVAGALLHGCAMPVELSHTAGATISDTTTGDITHTTAMNCLNGVGDNVHVANFSCHASNDWVFGCGANFTGCGTTALGRNAGCAVDLSTFAAPCH